jgi:hypothetical protein
MGSQAYPIAALPQAGSHVAALRHEAGIAP